MALIYTVAFLCYFHARSSHPLLIVLDFYCSLTFAIPGFAVSDFSWNVEYAGTHPVYILYDEGWISF